MSVSLKNRLKELSLSHKFVLIGSALAFISVFLPWYSDIDRFKTGDTFLGITGPLYLVGIMVLVASLASFGIILMRLLDKPAPKLPVSENYFHIFTSSVAAVMLVLALSVYFHPKFGVNLIDKAAGIGLYLSFIGSGLVMLGGFLANQKREVKRVLEIEDEGEAEPLIKIEDDTRVQGVLEKAKESAEYTQSVMPRPPVSEKPYQEREPIGSSRPIQEHIDRFHNEKDHNTNDIRY